MAESADSLNITPEQLTQHPEASVMLAILGSLVIVIVVGFLVMAGVLTARLAMGRPILRVQPWTPRVWGLIDLFLVVIMVAGSQYFVFKLWSRLTQLSLRKFREEGDFPLSAMAAGSLSFLVAMVLAIAWLVIRYGASLSHLGFTFSRLRSHIALGVGTTLISLPPVYFLMWLVSTKLDKEYDHPLLTGVMKEGTLSAFLLGTFCAVIAAPIWEEFVFRVLLQGWLQSIPLSWKHFWWFTGASEAERGTVEASEPPVQHVSVNQTPALATDSQSNPYAAPLPLTAAAPSDELAESTAAAASGLAVMPAPPLWPVFVSGTIFGLAHLGYGLSFIPLILLGIILGFLYRATHSIWPSFVVHFIVNSIAVANLGIMTYLKTVVQ
jgi:membrane protease YdiL (CAAX protease family)